MENLPAYVNIVFVFVTVAAFGFLLYGGYHTFQGKRTPLTLFGSAMLAWLLVTGLLAYNDFYQNFEMPPRLFLFVGPTFLLIIILLIIPASRTAILRMPITTLTYLHIIRIPVELCLWWLFKAELVAEEMTFEGSNFDILAGITAPFAGVFLVGKKSNNRLAAILWNLLCLGLVLNVVIRAISLTPYFYDGSGAELQNIVVFYFPFVWLPVFVVPTVIFGHLVSLIQLFKKAEN